MPMHCILTEKGKLKHKALISAVSYHYRCFHVELFEQTLWLRSGTNWDRKIIFSLSCLFFLVSYCLIASWKWTTNQEPNLQQQKNLIFKKKNHNFLYQPDFDCEHC